MSKSPGRNNLNNTVAIVARPGLRSAPTSTSFPPTHTHTHVHTHTCTRAPLHAHPPTRTHTWHPSLHTDHPMNKNENPKMDGQGEREGRVGSRGQKNKVPWQGSARDFFLHGSHTLTRVLLSHSPNHPFSSTEDHTDAEWFHDATLVGNLWKGWELSWCSSFYLYLCGGCVGLDVEMEEGWMGCL